MIVTRSENLWEKKRRQGKGESTLPTPVDYSSQETQRDVYTLDQTDPLFRPKSFEKPGYEKTPLKAQPIPPPLKAHPKPLPTAQPQPQDLPHSFYEASGESYLKARRVAEMKFNTLKLVLAYVCSSLLFVGIDYFTDPDTWWSYWPIGFWGVVVSFPLVKCFVFRGRDIRAVIETRLHRMALREVERFDSDL